MLTTLALLLASPQAAAPCPATPAPLPAELRSWTRPTAVTAGADAARAMRIRPGETVRATLLPRSGVRFAFLPPKGAGHAGLFGITVERAGRYKIALGDRAWIDMIRDGAPLPSVAHGHGLACSGIAKLVEFDLRPGRYLVQITGSATRQITLLATPVATR
ncbi:hypothetical protein [Sphingomonas sp. Leaf4]|uniref:hypothetical protein n=1 Tax=Sphingomonas sp. Leaf4 TaxID=2876553 RepID=UPI001E4741DA|nr:hypothetical protein [Sphingomonas sp. Leaf4]